MQLTLLPNRDRSCLWLAVVDEDRKVTAAAGNDLPLPAADQLLISTGGMDCELVCREPIKRWTVVASASELTLDLTYHTAGVLSPLPDRYALPSEVRGSLVAGGRRAADRR